MRVGLIGTDGHTGVILESIPQLPGAELTAFAKSLPEDDVSSLKRAKAFSEKTRIYDHFEQMLEKEELDVVGVCLPYYRNAEASIAAARRGVHVVSEKPVTRRRPAIGLTFDKITQQAVPTDDHRWIESCGCTRSYRRLRIPSASGPMVWICIRRQAATTTSTSALTRTRFP